MAEEYTKRERARRVYSTALINKLIDDRNQGYDIDFEPFFNRDTDLRNANIPFKMTDEEMEEYQKCYDDPEYFIGKYCKFMTDKGMSTVQLRDYQTKVIDLVTQETYDEELEDAVPKNRNIIWLASRQIGKTTTTSAFMAWMIVFHIDKNILIVANKEKTAIEIVDKIINIFKNLPFFLKPGCDAFGKTGLKLDNGSKIISSATTNTASIGFTIHCVYLDEFAHIPDNIVNNFWRSVYPTLSSSKVSQCIITSTPNGTTNKFYEIWSKSLSGENSFANVRTDYWEVPGHDDEWAKKQIADFGEEEFAQEFALQFNKNSKMILKSHTMSYISKIVREFEVKNILSKNQYLESDCLTWDPGFDPNNINEKDKFVFIVDLAEGNGDPDEMFKSKKKTPDSNTIQIYKLRLNSVANVRRYSEKSCGIGDCVRFEQVGKFTCNTEDEIYTARVCSALAYNLFKDHELNNVRVMVEMNFNGKSFFEEFKRHIFYSGSTILKTYHRKPVPGEQQKKKPGFKTTQNKEHYCLKGNKMLDMRRIIVKDKATFEQMKSFGYVRGKLTGIACHDDLSMPVFNHIPRMLDEKIFIGWIEEFLVFGGDNPQRVYELNQLIRQWAIDNPEMTQESFETLYGLNEPQQIPSGMNNPYFDINQSQMIGNPYAGMSPYNSPYTGMGGSVPYGMGTGTWRR